jgi:dolichyl-diphosphooligosaccharide--protein glycosyltransferase
MPVTDDWSRNSVENYYKNSIVQQVNTQYPNLPAAQKNTIVDKQWNDFYTANKVQLEERIVQTSLYFKTGFQYEENGATHTFLGDLDSYYYLRQARNVQEKGYVCDYIADDGKCVDDHMLAPIKSGAGASMHPYGEFYLYKILHSLNSKITLMDAAFYLPTVIAALGVLAAFFIGRKLMNDVGGFFAAMFFATSPLLVTRTLGSDTDIWNIVFPLLIIWMFLEAFETKKLLNKIIFTSITGLLMALFAFAWGGWWYIFYFILAALIGHIGFLLLKNLIAHKSLKKMMTKEVINDSVVLGVLFASTAIFVSIIYSLSIFISSLQAPFMFSDTLKVASAADLWPNVLTTVAELNEASLQTVVGQASFGLNILFSLSLLGIIFLMVKKKPDFKDYMLITGSAILYVIMISQNALVLNYKIYLGIIILPVLAGLWLKLKEHNEHDIKPALILLVWFVGMIFVSTRGIRFVLLLVPAFCIALGVAIGYLYQYFERIMHENIKLNLNLSKIIVFVILALILIMPVQSGISSAKSYMPSITKGWWDSLTKIRQESSPDAIIISWWDFGHWFKYVADRRVTFDGASQLGPLAHWAGRSLQTNSETETLGILRMLACGSNKAFEEVNKKYDDAEKSQNVVADIILMEKDDAETYLKDIQFTNTETVNILQYSHCNPPEVYYVTSEDMVGKAGVWAHFGLWDIDRAFIINEVKPKSLSEGTRILKERFNYSDDEAARVYYEVQALRTDREMNDWISPWPSYAGGLVNCANKEEMVQCNLNLAVSNNGQTVITVDRFLINMSQPENSQIVIAGYEQATGRKLSENPGSFEMISILDGTLKEYKSNNASIGLSILLNVNRNGNETSYQAIVANTQLVDSTFTRLFYLDGKGMDSFEKFSDVTDITGTRINIWKVKW